MIAGSCNQAKRILEKYDEVLYGSSPEELVEETHKAIRGLLASQECTNFMIKVSKVDEASVAAGDEFVRKITEAVAPIIPITLRNKYLDGGYLRTALQFLGAVEIMFTQYETDVRTQANPAGVVGMCNTMHSEIERAALYNEELKPLDPFTREMRAQYLTSLGLGSTFARDTRGGKSRRGRRTRGRAYYHAQGSLGQNFDSGHVNTQQQGNTGLNSGARMGFPNSSATQTGWNANGSAPSYGSSGRGRGECYDYRSGNCRRGRSCRFLHLNN